MTIYTAGRKPVNETDLASVSSQTRKYLDVQQGTGKDGLDVALGALSALRMFVLYNVGPEGVQQELNNLAEVLRLGE